MNFELFEKILSSAQRIDTVIDGLEETLGIQFGDGLLIDIQVDLLSLLVNECEYDTSGDDVIYKYAFDDKWGKNPVTYHIEDKKYLVDSPASLYAYVTEKFNYESARSDLSDYS